MRAEASIQYLPIPKEEGELGCAGASVRFGNGFQLWTEGDLSVVSLWGIALYHFRDDDKPARYLAMVDLVRHHGIASTEIAAVFNVHRVTVQTMLRRFEKSGLAGLLPGKKGKRPSKIRDAVERQLLQMKAQGVSNNEAARRLGVTPKGVRKALRRLGYEKAGPFQPSLQIGRAHV